MKWGYTLYIHGIVDAGTVVVVGAVLVLVEYAIDIGRGAK